MLAEGIKGKDKRENQEELFVELSFSFSGLSQYCASALARFTHKHLVRVGQKSWLGSKYLFWSAVSRAVNKYSEFEYFKKRRFDCEN